MPHIDFDKTKTDKDELAEHIRKQFRLENTKRLNGMTSYNPIATLIEIERMKIEESEGTPRAKSKAK